MKRIDGELVANGMTRLRVDVTKQDIERGQPLDQNSCAIAVACIRQIKNVVAAKVHKGRLYLKFEGQARWRRWFVPEYATREIVAFDRGGRFVPQQIDFDPPPVPVLARYRQTKTERLPRKRRKPRRIHRTLDVRDEARKDEPTMGDK